MLFRSAVAVSATTRARRPGETDGVEYRFLDDREFQRLVDEGAFLEHVSFAGGRYGTLAAEVDRLLASGHGVILELEIDGAFNVRRRRPDALLVFIDPPGTGYSRVNGGDQVRERFYSVQGDIDGLAAFVMRWLKEKNRLTSPTSSACTRIWSIRGGAMPEIGRAHV